MPYAKTVPSWIRQITWHPGLHGACADSLCDGAAVTRRVYGPQLSPMGSLLAFAYCWRRFGPPVMHVEEPYHLARYYLSTSHPEIFLTFHLGTGSLECGVGYLATESRYLAWTAEHRNRFDAGHPAVLQAVTDALEELLRPVWIEEEVVNILGPLPAEHEYCEDEEAPIAAY